MGIGDWELGIEWGMVIGNWGLMWVGGVAIPYPHSPIPCAPRINQTVVRRGHRRCWRGMGRCEGTGACGTST